MGRIIVHELTTADLYWGFEQPTPYLVPQVPGDDSSPRVVNGTRVEVDPFPGYPHDPATLRSAVDVATAAVLGHMSDLRWDVHLYSADREATSRSNGHSQLLNPYDYETRTPLGHLGLIFLSGKRIMPHPAMTRSLVAHELGHNVEYMLQDARAEKEYSADLITEYATRRGLPADSVHHGSGGRWHDSAHEVFACDFRILVCGVEAEYWPHPGVVHPSTLPGMRDWWLDALPSLTAAAPETVEQAA